MGCPSPPSPTGCRKGATEAFWLAVRGNLDLLTEARGWWDVVAGTIVPPLIEGEGDSCAPRWNCCRRSRGTPTVWADWTDGAEGGDGAEGEGPVPAAAAGADRRGSRAGAARSAAADGAGAGRRHAWRWRRGRAAGVAAPSVAIRIAPGFATWSVLRIARRLSAFNLISPMNPDFFVWICRLCHEYQYVASDLVVG